MSLQTKSVSSKIEKDKDGLRILATRSPGMYVKKSRYDIWMPNLGPSEPLLKKIWNDEVTWPSFVSAYKKELLSGEPPNLKNKNHKNRGQMYTLRLIKRLAKKGNVTLLCHCEEDEQYCHRHALQALIKSKKI